MPQKALFSCAILLIAMIPTLADDTVRSTQEELRRRNLYFGDIDGKRSAELIAAVKRYQERKGLSATGEIDGETASSLSIPGAVANKSSEQEWPDLPVLKSDAGRVLPPAERIALEQNPEPEPTAAPPAESPEPMENVDLSTATEFVQNYLRDAAGDNPEAQTRYYAYPLRYFDHGTVDHDFVLRDTLGYLKHWPRRTYALVGPVTLRGSNNSDETLVQFTINFTVINAKHSVHGRTNNFWTVRPEKDGQLKITSIREERLRD